MDAILAMLLPQIGPLIIAAVVPAVVAGFKKVWPSVPKVVLPLAAAALGPVFDIAMTALAGIETTGTLAVIAGLAGVGLREIKDQIVKSVQTPA